MAQRSTVGNESGFTLVEVIVAAGLIAIGLLGTVALVEAAIGKTAEVKRRQAATSLGRELIEGSRAIPYTRLTPATIETELQARPGTADSNDSDTKWTIRRGRTTYEVSAAVCTVDDPGDGIADHSETAGGQFCFEQEGSAAPTPTTPPDDNPDDYRRARVRVTWEEARTSRQVVQTTLIPNPGSASGPKIISLTRSPTEDPIVDDTQATVTFTGVTATPAATVRYMVDGTIAASVVPPGDGKTSTFDWTINVAGSPYVPDCSYVISAQALDSRGFPGTVRSLPVRLNRRAPDAPGNFVATWNPDRGPAGTLDFEWAANDECDVVGYRVHRKSGTAPNPSTDPLVCETEPSVTACEGSSSSSETEPLDYYILALDQDAAGATRMGATTSLSNPVIKGPPPQAPSFVQRTNSAEGVTLDWGDSPAGESIRFYRVYRAGTSIADRYSRVSPSTVTDFVDTSADGGGATYYVTSVDENWVESAPTAFPP